MRRSPILLALLHALLLGYATLSTALAQANNVSLGQVGSTNTVTIDQTGANNLVGGASDDLRLNQLGDRNAVTILQVGEGNGVGRENRLGRAGFLTGETGVAAGLYQRGDGNVLDITQRTFREPGSNLVGAIAQSAPEDAPGASNRAVIVQVGGAPAARIDGPAISTGPGFHAVGEIAQAYVASVRASGVNEIAVEQAGVSQTAEQLRQSGAANRIVLRQSVSTNALRIASQNGAANSADVSQDGTSNAVGNLLQSGASNGVELRMDGTGNFVDQIVQAGLGGLGDGRLNSATVAIVGDDNGGEGIGGYRAMSGQAATLGTFTASIEQFGDDNAFMLTVGSATAGRADGNAFSAGQSGMGNQASAVMLGDGNLLALRQSGDGNVLDIEQSSTASRSASAAIAGNSAIIEQIGDGNRFGAGQSGAGHRLDVRIEGNRNDGTRIIAGPADLLGRGILQRGEDHAARVRATGSFNVFSIVQMGTAHIADIAILGNANMAAILQSGVGNIANSTQTGERNYAFVQQD